MITLAVNGRPPREGDLDSRWGMYSEKIKRYANVHDMHCMHIASCLRYRGVGDRSVCRRDSGRLLGIVL